MGWLGGFYRSTIGRKTVMAVSGLILTGYVVLHMTGNLLAFRGQTALNDYAKMLQSTKPLLWSVRVILLLAVMLHGHSAWTLTRAARAARPVGYTRRETLIATLASRSMRWGGVLLLVFIVYHILHLTTGTVHPGFVHGDAYGNIVTGFEVRWVAAFYIVAMVALALHLRHGVWSVFQTLGAAPERIEAGRQRLAWALALVVPIGFIAVPLGVLLGWIG